MEIKTAEEIYEEHGCSKKSEILEAMKKYAEQFIDLAAEEAYCTCEIDWNDFHDFSAGHNGIKGELQKESILEIKKQIK